MEAGEREVLGDAGITVEDEIGRGAFGVVYRGRQLTLDRPVALKRLPSQPLTEPQAARRLDTEIAALVRLEHPSVVRLFDVKRTRSALWLVMEYADGPTLRALVARHGGLGPADSLAVLEQLSEALDHLARHGIVHRDVKPENVLVCAPGRCKLGDFGLALLAAAERPPPPTGETITARLTRPGTVLGTPSYLSPEQAEGREASRASDIYSLGVVAYELFAGRVPFESHGNLLAVLAAHAYQSPPVPSSLGRHLTPEIDATLLWALEKDAARRPQTASDFWQRLEAAARAVWPDWRRQAHLGVLTATPSPATSLPPPATDGLATVAATPGGVVPPGTVEEDDALAGTVTFVSPLVPAGVVGQGRPAVAPPLPRPSRVRQGAGNRRQAFPRLWVVLAAAFALAAGGSFLAAHALTGKGRSGGSQSRSLSVQSVVLSAHRPAGATNCRSVSLVAEIHLVGGPGTLRYDWVIPQAPSAGSLYVKAGTASVSLGRHVTLASSSETVRLSVATATTARAKSLPVSARC